MQQYIDSIEKQERIKHRPELTERAPDVEIDDVTAATNIDDDDEHKRGGAVSLRKRGIKLFSLESLDYSSTSDLLLIIKLDVSNNELSSLPGLAALVNLEVLSLRRNWFDALPPDIGRLTKLREINASRNFLKPTNESLKFHQLISLDHLKVLDLKMNQKCRTVEHRSFIQSRVSNAKREVTVLISIWQEMSSQPGCIGCSAAVRNPCLLRSQLEPWGTVQLRRRLVRDFGMPPTDPEDVGRAEVMEMLLNCYREEGLLQMDELSENSGDLNFGVAKRPVVKIEGTPVRQDLLDSILKELRDWKGNAKRGGSCSNRERPSINAKCYLILRAPTEKDGNEHSSSRQERRRQKKMEHNQTLWELAMKAMHETDPEFALRCSEIAVTYGFIGSPHIDRQNSSAFYGLSIGNFTEGTGCVAVEISPRVVAEVNTKNRLGKVDGRYPHWVSDYAIENEERFSLIYYDTLSKYQAPGPAIFRLPS